MVSIEMDERSVKAKKALIKALAYVNAVMVPLFMLGVLLFLEYRWQLAGFAGLVLAALSPFIAYLIVYVAIKKRVVKIDL